MNTLRDTDEGRARPSVWPVYVTSGMIGIFGAVGVYACFLGVLAFPKVPPEGTWMYVFVAVYMGLFGGFSLVTAIGIILLRPWAWRLATVWGCLIGLGGLASLGERARDILFTPEASFFKLDKGLYHILVALAVVAFIVWTLNTRRRLFFPPKPEGEE